MLNKIWIIFKRDLKVNSKDFISLYILVVPILFAVLINVFSPGINDTTVDLALIKGGNTVQVEYLEQFAKIELFENTAEIKDRVEKRDAIIGIIPENDGYYLMTQGDEPEGVVEYAKLLTSFYELDMNVEDSTSEIIEFGRTVPPLKKILVNISILFISILAGMLIALNIVEEKVENTLSAINVTPTSRSTFILGKSVIGVIFTLFGSIALIMLTGFSEINLVQLLLILLVTSLLSIIVGFIQGVTNKDIMSAAGSIKLLFLPLIAGVLAIEMLGDKWQKFFYWNPFYWAYKGNDIILSQTGTWGQIFMYAGIVLLLSSIIYLLLAPKIRKGLK
ncbi:ABC-type Na+ efflux pump, permease component [Carnobacterium alterfunditum]|uniref:ABC-type Na+ efflux pump, permease component n=1 Tax=Carnobacterium alterfunditum TaxID=28230 RepID=A0A1N6ET16_9LACT|nr:ABC transporter permease [Carnobacterium alterfunditum]SIN86147.1 ABC-type Na+ efflux pump, permease component [Carnobacterium alterfunditum]